MFRRGSTGAASKITIPKSVEIEQRKILQVGRNDPCPCGSGKKYKVCHAEEGEEYLLKLAREEEKARKLAAQKEAGVPWYKRLLTRLKG